MNSMYFFVVNNKPYVLCGQARTVRNYHGRHRCLGGQRLWALGAAALNTSMPPAESVNLRRANTRPYCVSNIQTPDCEVSLSP